MCIRQSYVTLFSSTFRLICVVCNSIQRIEGLISSKKLIALHVFSLSKNAICTAFLINEQVEQEAFSSWCALRQTKSEFTLARIAKQYQVKFFIQSIQNTHVQNTYLCVRDYIFKLLCKF